MCCPILNKQNATIFVSLFTNPINILSVGEKMERIVA